jgi:hypothetical protein
MGGIVKSALDRMMTALKAILDGSQSATRLALA